MSRVHGDQRRRWQAWVARCLWGLVVAALLIHLIPGQGYRSATSVGGLSQLFVTVAVMAFLLAFATVGALVASRVPANPIGWLLLGSALAYTLATAATGLSAPRPAGRRRAPSASGAGHLVAVRHRGELLGALSVTKKRGDAVTPTEDRLIGNLATQAGLVLRNAGLTEQLLARLAELRASRERLVTTQDSERQRLERDLRDGPQRELAGLAGKLGDAAHALDHDEARAKALLDEVTSEIAGALASLRELARGIYPPLLADMGIAAALDAQARRAPIPVSVETDGIGRYPEEIEAAVYFCALEALRSAAWHADATQAAVRLSANGGDLRFEVTGDGQRPGAGAGPWGADLQAMADRVNALGGEILIAAAPGRGTRINGRVPVPAVGLPVHGEARRRRGR